MGLFGFLKKKNVKPVPNAADPVVIELRIPKVNEPEITPDQLRQQLFDAASSGDEQQLCTICQAHEKSIFQQGMLWSKVPAEIRESPVLMRWYTTGLKAIARFCADRLGKPELMEQIKAFESLPAADENKDAGQPKK